MSEERRREQQDETPREPDVNAGLSVDAEIEFREADTTPDSPPPNDPKPDPPTEQRLEP